MNKRIRAIITNMDEPLGHKIGNALEVEEAIETLKGNGPKDLTELCIYLCSQLLMMCDIEKDKNKAIEMTIENLYNGKAYKKFEEFVYAQGAKNLNLPKAEEKLEVYSNIEGYFSGVNNKQIGEAACDLGAGRRKMSDKIDYSAGIDFHIKIGDYISKDKPIATLYTTDKKDRLETVAQMVIDAITISDKKVAPNKLLKYMVY